MRDRTSLLAAVIRESLDCVVVIDDTGRVIEWNPAAERTFGYVRDEAIGRDVADLIIPGHHREAHANGFSRYLREGDPHVLGRRIEVEARDRSGRIFPVELAITEVYSGNRRLFTASLRDLTSRVEAERALRESQERLVQSEKLSALGSLLAGVSHELNNPLSVVVGETYLLLEDAEGTPFEQRARRIGHAADRCTRIVRTFLAMARRRQTELVPTDINGVITEALELTEYARETHDITLRIDLADSLPEILVDRSLFHQVIVNLTINAQQAMAGREGSEVAVSTALEGADVVIRIADNGPGIPADIAARIFEPFFTTKEEGNGTGIGLSFSQGVIETHGGTLTLDRSAGGACFLIRLPSIASVPDCDD